MKKIHNFWNRFLARAGFRKYYSDMVQLSQLQLCMGRWPSSGPAVLLIHGLTGNHIAWKEIVSALHSFDLHAPDLRGRGRSGMPAGPYGARAHAGDMAEYLKQMGPACVVGHSFGAIIGLHLALKYPALVKKLVLLDGGAPMNTVQRLKVMRFLLKSLDRIGRYYPTAAAYLAAARQSPIIGAWSGVLEEHLLYELVHEKNRVRCGIQPSVMEKELEDLGGSLEPARIATRLLSSPLKSMRKLRTVFPYERIQCPVLILKAGRHNLIKGDELVSYAGLTTMLGKLLRASCAVLPDLNHYEMVLMPHERRDALIANFLKTGV